MEKTIHIGTLLQNYIKEKNVSKAALSRALGVKPANFEVRLKQSWIRTDILLKISQLLQHNFFADIGAILPKEYPSNKAADKTKDERITALELEITILKRERDMLSNLISKKIK
jgi:plasmid maintenance system antidote protein VapI